MKKFLAVLLAFVMILGVLPVISAEDEATGPDTTNIVKSEPDNIEIHLFNYDYDVNNQNGYDPANKNNTTAPPILFTAQSGSDQNYLNRDATVAKSKNEGITETADGNGGGTPEMYHQLDSEHPYPYVNKAEPKVNGTTVNVSGSLQYLFDENLAHGVRQSTGVTHYEVSNDGTGTGLFQKDPETGKYYYNSAYNHAVYNAETKKFTLYDFALRPFGGSSNYRAQGHFLPFNSDYSEATQLTDSEGKFLNENGNDVLDTLTAIQNAANSQRFLNTNISEQNTDGTYSIILTSGEYQEEYSGYLPMGSTAGEDQKVVDNPGVIADNVWVLTNEAGKEASDYPDYWYGVSIEFKFNIPEKRLINGEEMVFDFLGDDDVWVYIDDKLVLDLSGGGCQFGNINFTQGTGTHLDPDGERVEKYCKTFDDVFGAGWEDDEFAAYTTHTLKFFYLERGTGTANCKLEFNLEPLPTNTLTVEKEVKGLTDEYKNNEEFTYILTDEEGYPVKNEEYTHRDAAGKATTKYTGAEDGSFTLKNGEKAEFVMVYGKDESQLTKYKVSEIVDSTRYTASCTGATSTLSGNMLTTDVLYLKDENSAIALKFTNTFNKLLGDLKISKTYDPVLTEDQSSIFEIKGVSFANTGIEPFTMQVAINGADSVTVKDLPIGTYEVRELTDWTWRYSSTVNQASQKVVEDDSKAPEFAFTNTRTNEFWLSGDNYKENWWGGNQ